MLAFFADSIDPIPVLLAVAIALILLGFVILVVKRYKRCPSNRVLVIFGKVASGQSARCLHGGGAFVWPLIQDYAFLSLDPMQIEIRCAARSPPRTSASTCRRCSRWRSAPAPR